jgi:para-nitrobenzyl esterase
VSLAKTGNPNHPKIPDWPAYDADERATMIFDNEVRVENDPRSEIRKFWEYPPPRRG